MTYLHDTTQDLKVNKSGRNMLMINPIQLKTEIKFQVEKLKDNEKLLEKHYGRKWHELETLHWFKDSMNKNNRLAAQPKELKRVMRYVNAWLMMKWMHGIPAK